MLLQDTITLLKTVQKKLNNSLRINLNKNEKILIQTAKISEEIGELNNEIINLMKNQRIDKSKKSRNLDHELADVIMATILLGIELEIDIENALSEKIAIIKGRF